jgi:hypothetical protein
VLPRRNDFLKNRDPGGAKQQPSGMSQIGNPSVAFP